MKVLHTSDRLLFKRCRRKWDFESPLRQNLEVKGVTSHYFFIGTGFHYALERYHGYGEDPIEAFENYYNCFTPEELTMEIEAYATMIPGMFNHYIHDWLPKRRQFKTLFIDGKPQVEVEVVLELKELSKLFGEPIYYSMRFDRVVEDEYGRLWIMDYKTVAGFNTDKLETDLQISVYSWGAELYYQRPVEGMVYLQFKKALIQEPRILKKPAGAISIDKTQNTNYDRYLQALKFKYGCMEEVPPENLETLEFFAKQEDDLGDAFIRYDMVRRSKANKQKQYEYIIAEGKDMLNKELPIYPNQTQDCFNFCSFRPVCLAMDDNTDWKFILDNNYQTRVKERDSWRSKLTPNG
jgi:hypothetical protein